MSVVTIPIVNNNYSMGCEDGQEARLITLGKMVDSRARDILAQIGPLPEASLLATLCIVLADELQSRMKTGVDEGTLEEIMARIKTLRKKIPA